MIHFKHNLQELEEKTKTKTKKIISRLKHTELHFHLSYFMRFLQFITITITITIPTKG